MQVKVPEYTASEKQTLFHQSTADETLYGGAAGGGKTAALVAEAVTTALQYPGITIYIFRKTIPELKKTIVPEIRKQCAAYVAAGHMNYNGVDRIWQFDNGSTLHLAYCQNPGDEYHYQGAEMQLLIFDELTHFSLDQYEYLKTRVRSSRGDFPMKVMAATNPGNIGHGWVKSRFIDGKEPYKIYNSDTGFTTLFIPARVDDHPDERFREQYTRTLDAIADPDMRRALREGDWDVFAGQAFSEWRSDKHVVAPFTIPDHWVKWLSYDYGFNTYAAAIWFTRDPQTNRVYAYREFYESQMPASDQARQINQLSSLESVRIRLADPSIWKSVGNADTGERVADILQKAGLNMQPANNDRLAGKNAVHEALKPMPDGLPGLQVFSSLINLIRTLPSLPYDQHRIEDIDTNAEDHLYDCLRYGLMHQAIAKTIDVYKPQSMLTRKYRK